MTEPPTVPPPATPPPTTPPPADPPPAVTTPPPSSAPQPTTTTNLINAIVAMCDVNQAAALQDAYTRREALTAQAQQIVIAADAWITDQVIPPATPPPSLAPGS